MATPKSQKVVISREATPSSHKKTPRKQRASPTNATQQYDKENQMPGTPGFENLQLLNCVGPAIEYPTSPTMNVKRRAVSQPLSQSDRRDKSGRNEELHTDEFKGDLADPQQEHEEQTTDVETDIEEHPLVMQEIEAKFHHMWSIINDLRTENKELRERIMNLENDVEKLQKHA